MTVIKFPLNRIVEVLWHDITTENTGWASASKAAAESAPALVKTIGYVLEDTPKILKLAMLQSTSNDGEVGVICSIPKGTIVRTRTLKGM